MTAIRRKFYPIAFLCLGAILAMTWHLAFTGRTRAVDARFPADNSLRTLSDNQKPGFIEDASDAEFVLAIRGKCEIEPLPRVFLDAMLLIQETPMLVRNAMLAEKAGKKAFLYADAPIGSLAPLLPLDGATPVLFGNVRDSEALDLDGRPVRWRQSAAFLAGLSPPRPWLEYREPPPPKAPVVASAPKSAGSYRSLVENFARRYGLNVALVLAIIHSESNFSPTLVSSKSAMGLMQILPGTASDEIHRYLYGKRGQIGFEDLRNPELNIRYGTTYLHILHTRYFPEVKDREIRETCVIAAYNLGPNRFIRLYGASPGQAAEIINSMSLPEFLEDLNNRLPARETRNFVEKVRRMKNFYASSQ